MTIHPKHKFIVHKKLHYKRKFPIERRAMKLWHLILFLLNSFHHWTPTVADGTYRPVMNGSTLVNVEIIGDPINVNLSNSNIRAISNNAFDALTNVTALDLSENRINNLPLGLFSKLNNLRELSLADTDIESTTNVFHGLNNLMRLDMRRTSLEHLESGFFVGLPKSVEILFSPFSLSDLSTAIFKNSSDTAPLEEEDFISLSWPSLDSDPRIYRICMTDGILESVEETTEANGCTLYRPRTQTVSYEIVDLNQLGIKGFKNYWYRITNPKPKVIYLNNNNIANITPELVNYLPQNIIGISLAENDIKIIENNGIRNDHLRLLWLDFNNITIIEDGAFDNLKLTQLFMEQNALNSTKIIKSLPATLEKLKIDGNFITEIINESFSHLRNLRELGLSYNQLETLQPDVFKNLESLEFMNFRNNEIRELKPGLFKNLKKLSTVIFSRNKIEEIPSDTFRGMNISQLFLNYNRINVIERGAFSNTSIDELYLESNGIHRIEEGAFRGAIINKLYLEKNLLTEFTKESFNGIEGVDTILLDDNPIRKIEKGSMLNLKNATFVSLQGTEIEVLGDGMLFGLSSDNVNVRVYDAPIELIQGGLFDDV